MININIDYYAQWLGSCYGKAVYDTEITLLKNHLANIFGFHIIQIGTSCLDYLNPLSDKIKINHKLILCEHSNLQSIYQNKSSLLNCKDNAIPLESNSIDAVMIAHGLEFSSDPHRLLREVDRILLPEGHLVILCFNPRSLWGIRKFFALRTKENTIYPWSGKWITCNRVMDWLSLLNYNIDFKKHYFFRPCINNKNILDYTHCFDKVGKIIPLGSAGFCIIATKRQEAFGFIRPNWSNKINFVNKPNYEPSCCIKADKK